ncbi:tRNA (N6-isopentenyl adenosine(37)-C2)-methylthiotransferase MiaB [Verrucomicrobiota bacterium]
MKVAIKTYGCQMNERDSEMVGVLLQRQGYALTRSESGADIVIVNTCSVRGKAEEKALGKLGLLVASKQNHPGRIVGAVGCMVQRLGHDILRKVRGLDFAVGTHRLWTVPSVVDAVREGHGPIIDVSGADDRSDSALGAPRVSPESVVNTHEKGVVSAFINVLFGCDRRCTYCVVPEVRGKEWSRPAQDVIKEADTRARNGVKEITLLGQSVMSYGRRNRVWTQDYPSEMGLTEPLPRLLEALNGIRGLARVRFTSGHPSGCTEELVRAMVELPAVCEHVHFPVQSGSDRILERMNRGYVTKDFRAAAARLRAAIPHVAVTTDVIVGFPSETVDDFEMTRAFMEEIGFDNAFVFKYSSRPGTPAAEWADDVSEKEKFRRNHVILDDQNRRSLKLNQAWIGREVEVLVAGKSKRNASRWSGRTRTNKIVVFDALTMHTAGELVMVTVDRAGEQTLYGRVKT